MKPVNVKYNKLRSDIQLPEYQTDGASGADLRVALPGMGEHLSPGETKVFSTGLEVEIPDGYELQIRPRSSLSIRGIIISFGTVDSDYRGEIRVTMHNIGREGLVLKHGDRIAQLVLSPVVRMSFSEEEVPLTPTKRGRFGFGSTGK